MWVKKQVWGLEDCLVMALEYTREYRTYFHDFALPDRKALLKSDMEYDVILIDTTETPIERPKKSKRVMIQAKRKDIY